MRKSSLPLMLLPAIALGIYGVWTARQPRVMRAPGLYIENVEIGPVTARDASLGYDRLALVTLNFAGRKKPAWWGPGNMSVTSFLDETKTYSQSTYTGRMGEWRVGGLLFQQGAGGRQPVGTLDSKSLRLARPEWHKPRLWSEGRYVLAIRFKLQQIPRSERAVRLRIIAGENLGRLTAREVVVRAAGTVSPPPPVSRESGVKIVQSRVIMLPPAQAARGSDCRVEVDVRYLGSARDPQWHVSDNTHVLDSRGKEWTWFPAADSSLKTFHFYGPHETWSREPVKRLAWEFDSNFLPAGPLILKSGVGVGDGWQEPIRVVVRSGRGKAPRLRASSLEIVRVKVRQLRAAEKIDTEDTAVEILIRGRRILPQKPRWIYDHSQHLVSRDGRKFWTAYANYEPRWEASSKLWRIVYTFRAKDAPMGRLRFHAKLGLVGETLVPVDCVARR